ncbi:AraC family transcriptional regulator, partial [Streptomyces sp. SID8455]|nr:AraC family transcriptional regulator [Streptomyces sp. SID8455]
AAYRAAYRARRPQGVAESAATVLETVVPSQGAPSGRRGTPVSVSASAGSSEHSLPVPDAYVPGRPALPGQRSAP